MIIECIKEGFFVTNRNWQVVLLNVAAAVCVVVGFFIFVGIPVGMALVSLGIDLTRIKDILPGIPQDPGGLFSKYLGLVILVFISFVVYLTVVSCLFLYVFGGTLGVLRNTALNAQAKFSYSSFFTEAKKLFFPLLWLISISLLAVIGICILFLVLTAIAVPILNAFDMSGSTFSTFIFYFLSILIVVLVLTSMMAVLIVTAYAAIALVLKKGGVIDSFENAMRFVIKKPMAFLFCIILVVAITIVNLILMAIAQGFFLIPMLEPLINIPYQVVSYCVQSYLNVVMWGSLLVYYIRAIGVPVDTGETAAYDI